MSHRVEFVRSGRGKAQCPSDPNFPAGIAFDLTRSLKAPSCDVKLPYPAPECGMWIVTCAKCAMVVAVTAAGRRDDPISVKLGCALSETPEGPTPASTASQNQPEQIQVKPENLPLVRSRRQRCFYVLK